MSDLTAIGDGLQRMLAISTDARALYARQRWAGREQNGFVLQSLRLSLDNLVLSNHI